MFGMFFFETQYIFANMELKYISKKVQKDCVRICQLFLTLFYKVSTLHTCILLFCVFH